MIVELSEPERFPLLSEKGRRFLHRMRQHAHAPLWNWPNGEQLNETGLQRVHRFAERLQSGKDEFGLVEPDWLEEFKERCLANVPFFRGRSRPGTAFIDLPAYRRADLARQVWQFVPDNEPLDELITFSSSGTTGYPTRTPHHPYSAACGIPLLEHALHTSLGLGFDRGSQQVALANFAAYRGAYTTAIVIAFLNEAGCIRVNLDSSAWRHSDDSRMYLNAWQSPVWLADPQAFGALEKMELDYRPKAIISSIMHLNESYARKLSQRYGCPVLDVYAMTEAGIIAVRDMGIDTTLNPKCEFTHHRILAPDLFVEILDEAGNRLSSGQYGEITLTGGRNPYMPLLRYRTGDYGALEFSQNQRILKNLAGREPLEYVADDGRIVHSMEIVRLMRNYPIRHFELKTVESGYELLFSGDVDHRELESSLRQLLGQRLVGLCPRIVS